MRIRLIALALTLFFGSALYASDNATDDATTATNIDLIVADNPRKDRRDDRGDNRDDKQDCRQEEGRVGDDKRDCKQENRGEGDGDDEKKEDPDTDA
jgi:hypothetical protein